MMHKPPSYKTVDYWFESLNMEFDVFPKAHYELVIGTYCWYSFTTTRIPESQCIDLLKEKLGYNKGRINFTYSIYKKTSEGGRKLIHQSIYN